MHHLLGSIYRLGCNGQILFFRHVAGKSLWLANSIILCTQKIGHEKEEIVDIKRVFGLTYAGCRCIRRDCCHFWFNSGRCSVCPNEKKDSPGPDGSCSEPQNTRTVDFPNRMDYWECQSIAWFLLFVFDIDSFLDC